MATREKLGAASDLPDTSLEVGLADVVLAMHVLSPKSAHAEASIAAMLGFDWVPTRPDADEENDLWQPRRTLKRARASSGFSLERLWQGNPSASPERLEPVRRSAPPRLEEGDDFSVKMESVEELPEKSAWPYTGLPHLPLFKERWVRSIMSVLIAAPELLPRLDLRLIERLLASGSLIERLPYVSRHKMNRGVQLLLDVSESAQPFWRDGAELAATLRRLLDPTSVSVHKFKSGLWPEPHLTWWEGGPEFLREEVPVLIASNFGVTGRESPPRLGNNESLLMLLRQVRDKKCPLVALVPAAEADWPPDLKDLIPMSFVWDQPTSPQAVYRRRRR